MTNLSDYPPEFAHIPTEFRDDVTREVDDLIRRYEAGERDFRGIHLVVYATL